MKLPKYFMFIDESGDASLNHKGEHFVLSSIIIERNDFEIAQGYLRLLKRKYFADDYKVLHTTDLFERPKSTYPELFAPKSSIKAFTHELQMILKTVPYSSCVYYVDKNAIRKKHSYTPAKGRKPANLNTDLPYELCATQAILDFTSFLKSKNESGEIVIESRLNKDSNFVNYFDNARKPRFPGGDQNPEFKNVLKLIPSLFISNKDSGNSGLELADIVSYVCYRLLVGDPYKLLTLSMEDAKRIKSAIKNSAYSGALMHKISE